MKITRKVNFRVIIEPQYTFDEETLERDKIEVRLKQICEALVEQIRRQHDVVESVYFDYDLEEICGFCDCHWEPDALGMPTCCDRGKAEYMALNAPGDAVA